MCSWQHSAAITYQHNYQCREKEFFFDPERFHRGRGLILLLAVATGFYMLKVPNWESLPMKY